MEQKINKYIHNIHFVHKYLRLLMHALCKVSEVCYFCTARGLIPKILFDFTQASWMHLPLARQTKSTIQNSHDWWASITELSCLGCSNKQSNVSVVLQSSQITRRLLTYSYKVKRHCKMTHITFKNDLFFVLSFYHHWLSILSWRMQPHISDVFQSHAIIFMHIISGDCGEHHLLRWAEK